MIFGILYSPAREAPGIFSDSERICKEKWVFIDSEAFCDPAFGGYPTGAGSQIPFFRLFSTLSGGSEIPVKRQKKQGKTAEI